MNERDERVGVLDFMVEPGFMETPQALQLTAMLCKSLTLNHGTSSLCASHIGAYYILFFIIT